MTYLYKRSKAIRAVKQWHHIANKFNHETNWIDKFNL